MGNLAPLQRSLTLPAGGQTSSSGPVDFNDNAWALPGGTLAAVDVPALTATQLPAGETLTYVLVNSVNASLSDSAQTVPLGVQTGVGSSGAPAATLAAKLANLNIGRYTHLQVTASTNANAAGLTVPLYFAKPN